MKVPDGWEVKPFSSLASLNMGQSPDSEFVNENQDGIAFLQGNAEFGDVNPQELYWVTVPKKTAKKGDILISVRAPVGDMNIADKEYCIGRGLSALTINKINQKFGFYALFQERVQLDRLAQGSTFLAIGKNDFDKLLIKYPKEKKEQEKIAKILSTLDKAIESTNRLIEKEKHIKTALMQELLTNGIDQNGKIRTNATHPYKPSELGLIPDEWEIVDFKKSNIKLIDGDRGTNYPKDEDFFEYGYCVFLSAKNVTKNGFRFADTQFISEDKDEQLRKGKLNKNDIVLTTRGTVGNIAYFNESIIFQNIRINSGMIILRNQNNILSNDYLYIFLKSGLFEHQVANTVFGSAQPQLTVKEIEKFNICFSNKNEQKQIAKILTTQDKKIEIEETNLVKLKELKKGLMNDLLSCKVRVKV